MEKVKKSKRAGVIIALMSEAAGIIDALSLKKIGDGFFESDTVVLEVLPDCGIAAAAFGATKMLERYDLSVLYNFGTVGTNSKSVKLFDIVSVSYAVFGDYDLSNIDGIKRGELPAFGDRYAKAVPLEGFPCATLKSADRFGGETLGTEIEDMELAAICFVAYNYGVKVSALKGVTNGRENESKDYKENKEKVVAILTEYAVKILEKI